MASNPNYIISSSSFLSSTVSTIKYSTTMKALFLLLSLLFCLISFSAATALENDKTVGLGNDQTLDATVRCIATVTFSEDATDRCLPGEVGLELTIRFKKCFFLTYRVLVCRANQQLLDDAVAASKKCIADMLPDCNTHPNFITCAVEIVQACTDGRFISDY